jgi:hypothetical protein
MYFPCVCHIFTDSELPSATFDPDQNNINHYRTISTSNPPVNSRILSWNFVAALHLMVVCSWWTSNLAEVYAWVWEKLVSLPFSLFFSARFWQHSGCANQHSLLIFIAIYMRKNWCSDIGDHAERGAYRQMELAHPHGSTIKVCHAPSHYEIQQNRALEQIQNPSESPRS